MNTTAPLPTPDQTSVHSGVEQLHTQIMAFTGVHGIDLFILSRDGRVLDSLESLELPVHPLNSLCGISRRCLIFRHRTSL